MKMRISSRGREDILMWSRGYPYEVARISSYFSTSAYILQCLFCGSGKMTYLCREIEN